MQLFSWAVNYLLYEWLATNKVQHHINEDLKMTFKKLDVAFCRRSILSRLVSACVFQVQSNLTDLQI